MTRNAEIAEFFYNIADILEIKNDNVFRIRAYRKAAQNIRDASEDVAVLAGENRLDQIPGVGKDLAAKIVEIVTTGRLKHYEKLKKDVPSGVLDLVSIPGVGPKTAKLLYDKLKVKNVDDLERKAMGHKISKLPGLGDRTERNILRGIELIKKRSERMSLKEAMDLADEILLRLKGIPQITKVGVAGSLRRMKETVRDIDLLTVSAKQKAVMDAFVKLPIVKDVIACGDTKSSILTADGVQVDIRAIERDSFGAALIYFTGSQAHNIHIRRIAKKMGLKVNEYGVFREKTGKRIAGKEEADVYGALKLEFIVPELREDRGEIEAAMNKSLPELVELSQIKGDLHVHSNWSDGECSIEELALAARSMGYKYVAVTDHSETLQVARGLCEKDVLKKLKEVESVNKKIRGIKILAGTEVDILQDGSLDYKKDILERFDIVVGAIHSGFKQPKEKLTERVLRAIDTNQVDIIAHPTGRLMGRRAPYEIDFDRIFKAARDANVCMEINAYPERLDLDDVNSRAAKDAGVKIAIGTDAHAKGQLGSMLLGTSVARRAWLTKKDVINTLGLEELLKFFRK